jgi:hypothetical protein
MEYKGGYWLLIKWSASAASLATWIPEAQGMMKDEDGKPGVQRAQFQLERASQEVTFCSKRDKWLVVEAEVCSLLDFRPFYTPHACEVAAIEKRLPSLHATIPPAVSGISEASEGRIRGCSNSTGRGNRGRLDSDSTG